MISRAEINALVPQNQTFGIIGELCNDPDKMIDTNVHLSKEDFPLDLHRIIFFAINNIVSSSGTIKEISTIDIDTYLSQFENFYKIFTDQNGVEYVQDAKDNANPGMFDLNYHSLKKMTILRKYVMAGFDISDLYDIKTDDSNKLIEQQRNLSNMTEEDLVNHYANTVNEIRQEVNSWNGQSEEFDAGDGLRDLLKNINDNPMYGYGFNNEYLNTLVGGMQLGKFMLRSLKTGGGKTRLAIMDLLHVSATETYNQKKGIWMKNENPQPSLFISTELGKDEIQIILICAITRISPTIIKKGGYDDATWKVINHGIKVLEETQLHFTAVTDFDIADVVNIIEHYVFNFGVKYVDFDYIQPSPKLLRSAKEVYGGRDVRDDQILLELASTLKNKAEELGVFIMSSTQLTPPNVDDYEVSRTESALRSSKSIADKIDIGIISSDVSKKDLKNLESIVNDSTINPYKFKPTIAHFVYKNRLGDKGVIVWSKVDLGTLREYPLFCTDYGYNLLEIPRTTIKVNSDGKYSVKDEIVF